MKTLSKKLLPLLLAMLTGTLLYGAEFELFRNGKALAVIVKAKNGGKDFTRDIQFFNDELFLVTGSRLPVVSAPVSGKNNILFKLEKRPLATTDDYSMTFPDKKTLLITATEQSARYALNRILQNHAGIRYFFLPLKGFYGNEINHYPRKKNISLPMQAFKDAPKVNLYRQASWRNRICENWNNNMLIHGVHMLPVEVYPVWKYAADQSWPKEILPVLKGKKFIPRKPAKLPISKHPYIAKRGYDTNFQFCWSNPKSVTIAVENIRELLNKEPDRKHINMDVNDNGGFCECKTCKALVKGKRNSIGKLDYSEIYWKWFNEVAKEVSKTHPHIIFRGIAYTEVLNPPSFKLHKNVLPVICMELVVMLDPKVGPVKQKLWDDWSSKAHQLGLYDYKYGEKFFLLPRVYMRSHAKLLKRLIVRNKVRFAYFESYGLTASCGPKQELLYRICWDPDLDVDKFLKKYYIDCVGKKAAPYLEKYYDFWEKYWTGKDMQKTQWYRTVNSAYMQLGEKNTHLYPLKKGDLKYVRSLMEKVVSLAGAPDEKLRARAIMDSWEYYEAAAKAVFGEVLPPDGKVKDAKGAVEILKALPEAVAALHKYVKHPFCVHNSLKGKNLPAACYGTLGKIMGFVKDPSVAAELKRLVKRKDLPPNLMGQIKIMLGYKAVNLIENGDLEAGKKLPFLPIWSRNLPGKIVSTRASSGKRSYRMVNGSLLLLPKMKPGKNYLFLCDIYIEKPEVEGRVNFNLGPSNGRRPFDWIRILNQCPTAGMWNTYGEVVRGANQKVNTLQIQFWSRNIERNNPIYLDNFRLYCLDDIK